MTAQAGARISIPTTTTFRGRDRPKVDRVPHRDLWRGPQPSIPDRTGKLQKRGCLQDMRISALTNQYLGASCLPPLIRGQGQPHLSGSRSGSLDKSSESSDNITNIIPLASEPSPARHKSRTAIPNVLDGRAQLRDIEMVSPWSLAERGETKMLSVYSMSAGTRVVSGKRKLYSLRVRAELFRCETYKLTWLQCV